MQKVAKLASVNSMSSEGEGPTRSEVDFDSLGKKITRPKGEKYQFDPTKVNEQIKAADKELKAKGLGKELPTAQDTHIGLGMLEHDSNPEKAESSESDDDRYLAERHKANATERRMLLRKANKELETLNAASSKAEANTDVVAEAEAILKGADGESKPDEDVKVVKKATGKRRKSGAQRRKAKKESPTKKGISENSTTTPSDSETAIRAGKEINPTSFGLPRTEMETVDAILEWGTSPDEIIENLNKNPEAGFSGLVDLLEAEIKDNEDIFDGLSPDNLAERAKFEDRITILNLAKEAAETLAAGESLYPDFDPEEPYEDISVTSLKGYLDSKIAKHKVWEKDLPDEQQNELAIFAAYFKTLRSQIPKPG